MNLSVNYRRAGLLLGLFLIMLLMPVEAGPPAGGAGGGGAGSVSGSGGGRGGSSGRGSSSGVMVRESRAGRSSDDMRYEDSRDSGSGATGRSPSRSSDDAKQIDLPAEGRRSYQREYTGDREDRPERGDRPVTLPSYPGRPDYPDRPNRPSHHPYPWWHHNYMYYGPEVIIIENDGDYVQSASSSYEVTHPDGERWVDGQYREVPVTDIVEGETIEVYNPAIYRKLEDGKLELVEPERIEREQKVRIVLTRVWVPGHYEPAETE